MLKLHCFPNENAPLTQLAADVRTSMLLRGVDTLSQLRTFFLLGRLRDAAVAQWRLEAAWACSNSDDLARFIREAPSTKRPGSTEIGLMGKNSRNSAAAVPLWEDLFERPGSWSLRFSAAAAARARFALSSASSASLSLSTVLVTPEGGEATRPGSHGIRGPSS